MSSDLVWIAPLNRVHQPFAIGQDCQEILTCSNKVAQHSLRLASLRRWQSLKSEAVLGSLLLKHGLCFGSHVCWDADEVHMAMVASSSMKSQIPALHTNNGLPYSQSNPTDLVALA